MVFTRSKARQQATEAAEPLTSERKKSHISQKEDEGSDRSDKKRSISAVRVTRFTRGLKSEAGPSRAAAEDEPATESLEELALRALKAMKNRPLVAASKKKEARKSTVAVSKEDRMKNPATVKSTKVGRKRIDEMETVAPDKDAVEAIDDGTDDGMETNDDGMETDDNVQPDVMMLESNTKKKLIPHQPRHSGVMVTSLQPCMKEKPYFSYSSKRGIVSASSSTGKQSGLSWGEREEELMMKSVVTSDFEKRETAPPMYVSKYARAKARKVSF